MSQVYSEDSVSISGNVSSRKGKADTAQHQEAKDDGFTLNTCS